MGLALGAFARRALRVAARACAASSASPRAARAPARRAADAARRTYVTLSTDTPRVVSPTDVFVTQEVDMRAIKWFGMNYNHALCVWQPAALARIYSLAAQHLVSQRLYPDAVLGLKYEQDFLIRGLSIDTHRGIVMKLTFLHTITPSEPGAAASGVGADTAVSLCAEVDRGTAYFGRRCLSYEEVTRIYGSCHVSSHDLKSYFRHLVDPFSLVTAALTTDVLDTFAASGNSFHPSYVYQDVCSAMTHLSRGVFAAEVAAAPGAFIADAPHLHAMLCALRKAGRKLLLLTNSDFRFVDVGMRHMLRGQLACPADWPALFDVVVVCAQRPSWFTVDAPFRSLNTTTNKVRWLPVRELRPGQVYSGGSFAELNRLTPGGMGGQDVLYMSSLSNPGGSMGAGRDPWEDLSVPSAIGWRTGAVVAEVAAEVRAQTHPRYRAALAALLDVERAVRLGQETRAPAAHPGPTSRESQEPLLELRDELKHMLNPRFGSCFRTLTGPTLFAHNVLRFSDVYTARLENLLALAPDHFLFPLRRALPHEPWVGSV